MSHVWSESIAAANLSRRDSPEAETSLLYVLTNILPITSAKFFERFDRVELWHDYLSIPQWQRSVQQALLLQLPEIYRAASVCLIHLEDVTYYNISAAFGKDPPTSHTQHSFTQVSRSRCNHERSELYKALCVFFRAKWFQRMWVSVEYAYCTQACLYTSDHAILCGPNGPANSFSRVFDELQQKLRGFIEEVGAQEFENLFEDLPLPILGPLADMRNNVQNPKGANLCFGEALAFVAGRDCRSYYDRILAMCTFLNISDYATIVQSLPSDPTDACLWLARRCLERGDYSPLLILRRDESIHPQARWLAGHQNMTWDMWGLGAQIGRSPTEPPNPFEKFLFDQNPIRLELAHCGWVKQIWVMDMKPSNPLSNFEFVLETLLAHYGHADVEFMRALERIYSVPKSLRGDSWMSDQFLHTAKTNRPRNWPPALEKGFAEFSRYESGSTRRRAVTTIIVQELRLDRHLRGAISGFSQLSFASNPLYQQDNYNDCLGTVICPGCDQSFIYRLSILKHLDSPASLYRIPHLEFASTLSNGVGLLIANDEIVGRMIYGTPACNCNVIETVQVQ
jgi:hypothetical protein